jgi:ATP-dependent Clp protease ATP-binding subunit ClpB
LTVTDAARKAIAAEGYDPTYGARPLKRIIQQRLQNPLATELLKGDIESGGGVVVDYDGEDFTFTPTETREAVIASEVV